MLSDLKATAEHLLHLESKTLGWFLCLQNALGLQAEDRPEAGGPDCGLEILGRLGSHRRKWVGGGGGGEGKGVPQPC